MGSMIMRKEEGPKGGGATCSVEGRDRVEGCGGGGRKELRVGFLFCLPLLSARSQQVWVWTAAEWIDVSFYSLNTLLHL